MTTGTAVLLPGRTVMPTVNTERAPARWQRSLLFVTGAILPLVSLSKSFMGAEETASMLARIAPVDVLVVLGIIGLAAEHKGDPLCIGGDGKGESKIFVIFPHGPRGHG